MLFAHVDAVPKLLPNELAYAQNLIDSLLAKNPEERIESARVCALEIDRILDYISPSERPVALPDTTLGDNAFADGKKESGRHRHGLLARLTGWRKEAYDEKAKDMREANANLGQKDGAAGSPAASYQICHFDVFISFKNLDSNGLSTRDSKLARIVYDSLSARGFSVFLSNVSLERLGESAYKEAIDRALDDAQVLVAVGTHYVNLDSQWVRYEWDGFIQDMLSGYKKSARVFTYIEDMSTSDLPRALRQTQCFIHSDIGLEKLGNFIENFLRK